MIRYARLSGVICPSKPEISRSHRYLLLISSLSCRFIEILHNGEANASVAVCLVYYNDEMGWGDAVIERAKKGIKKPNGMITRKKNCARESAIEVKKSV